MEDKLRRIDNMTSSELVYELKQNGLYNDYKDYSITAIKEKLKDRIKYFG